MITFTIKWKSPLQAEEFLVMVKELDRSNQANKSFANNKQSRK